MLLSIVALVELLEILGLRLKILSLVALPVLATIVAPCVLLSGAPVPHSITSQVFQEKVSEKVLKLFFDP